MTGKVAVQAANADDRGPQPVRQAHPGARAEPVDRAARPRQPQPRGRAGPAQPRRQGLHRPRGAAPVRLQPAAGDQHVRAVRPHARRRRVRQLELHAVRDTVDDRNDDQDTGGRGGTLVLLGARPQPAGSDHHRPDQSEGVRPRPGRRPSRRHGIATSACKLQASASAASPRSASAANGDTGSGTDTGSTGSAATTSGSSSSGGGGGSPSSGASNPAAGIEGALGQISAALGGGSSSSSASTPSSASSASSGGQTQQLLNYLLAP